MQTKRIILLAVFFGLVISRRDCWAQTGRDTSVGNPFIRNMYTADPSAHVWADGRLYVYASHDVAPPRGCDLMDQYHVFSTDDMVHWKDHGEILRASQLSWGRPEGGFMWAPDCAFRGTNTAHLSRRKAKPPVDETTQTAMVACTSLGGTSPCIVANSAEPPRPWRRA